MSAYYTLSCDEPQCAAEFTARLTTIRGTRAEARRRGWKYTNDPRPGGGRRTTSHDKPLRAYDLCPHHALARESR